MSGVDVVAVLDSAIEEYTNPRFTDRHGTGPELRKARRAIAELIEASARLSSEIEFRIDDPRSQLLDRVRRAVTGAVGCNCPARAKAGYVSHAPNCPARAALSAVTGGAK